MTPRKLIAFIAVIAVFVLWDIGALDRPLSAIGLNSHKCARSVAGATYCGSELEHIRSQEATGAQEAATAHAERESAETAQTEAAETAEYSKLSEKQRQLEAEGRYP